MKRKTIIFLLPLLLFFLCGASLEEDFIRSETEKIKSANLSSYLSEETEEILEIIGFDDISTEKILSFSFKDIISFVYESAAKSFTEPLKAVFYILSAAILCSVINCFCDNFSETGPVINAVSTLAVSLTILLPIKEIFTLSAKAIGECSDFMLGFIPVYSSAVAAAGNISSAAGYRTLMLGASSLIGRIASETVLPLICIFLAMCIAGSVSEVDIGEIAKSFKNFAVWVLTVSMSVFSAILGLGTLVSSSADASVSKTAKFLVGSAVPIVGSAVSDALVSLKGCLSLTKNVFGIYGIIVTAAIFLPILITAMSWKICLSSAASISKISGNKNLCGLLSSASSAMGVVLALLVVCSMMFIFSVSILMMTGGGF